MKTLKLYTRYFLVKNRLNKRGLVAIKCRVTYNGKRKDFSTGIFINPNHWDLKKQKLLPSPDEQNVNLQLDLIKNKINKVFLYLKVNEDNFDIADIYDQYLGKTNKKEMGVVEIYKLHNQRKFKLIGKEIVDRTYYRYDLGLRHLKSFINYQYKTSDKPLRALTMGFINDYGTILKLKRTCNKWP